MISDALDERFGSGSIIDYIASLISALLLMVNPTGGVSGRDVS